MKSVLIRFVLFLCVSSIAHAHSEYGAGSCVGYKLSGGRFGDNLLAVAHAKWVSYTTGVPLVYTKFPYSDKLQLSVDPSVVHASYYSFYYRYVIFSQKDYLNFCSLLLSKNIQMKTLIAIPYFPESPHDFRLDTEYFNSDIKVDWEDPGFKEELNHLFSPLCPIAKLEFPEGYTTVALHIRSGGGFDDFDLQKILPLKSPPLSYYIEALEIIGKIISKPLYVFIFTDDLNPERFKAFFDSAFFNKDIEFACRTEINKHDLNVLEDFFAFNQFDCLISTHSNFSYVASKVFANKIVITPVDYKTNKYEKIVIDPIMLQINDPSLKCPLKMVFRKTK